MTQLLNHLAFDDEMFWISAVLGGDDRAIAGLHNGWASGPMTGAEAVNIYKREIARSDEVPARIDLDAPPRWWPGRESDPVLAATAGISPLPDHVVRVLLVVQFP